MRTSLTLSTVSPTIRTMQRMKDETVYRATARLALFFSLYLAIAELARIGFAPLHAGFPPIWAPAGIAFAGAVLYGASMWPAIALGSLLFDLTIGVSIGTAVLVTAANTLAPLGAAYLLKRWNFNPLMSEVGDILLLFTAIFLFSWIVPAIYTGAILAAHNPAVPRFWSEFGPRWLGQLVSMSVLGTVIIRWTRKPLARTKLQIFEAVSAGAVLVSIDLIVFFLPRTTVDSIPLVYFILFPLLWISLRVGPRGMTLALFVTSGIAFAGIVAGPVISPLPLDARFINTEVFLVVLSILFLIFVSSEESRKNAYIATRRSVRELEEALGHIRTEDQAKNEFITVLAHELRNPLAAIATSAEIASLQLEDNNPIHGTMQTIGERVKTMARLLDDLLDISRISQKKLELKKEPIDMARAIENALDAARPLIAGRGHMLKVTISEPLQVMADPVRLEQIIVNLLTNAAKYTSAGGRIDIRCRTENKFALISIADSGIGIPDNMMHRVFEPFFQIKDSAYSNSGLGVGLSLTKQLVEMHGGAISVESKLSRGSTFTVRLPALVPEERALSLPSRFIQGVRDRISPKVPAKNIYILVVDDNQVAAQGLRELLSLRGYKAGVAYTGEGALAQIQTDPPDAVILDIGLPGMDGYEVARILKEDKNFNGAIVGLSGYGNSKDRQKSAASGFDRHLVKPVGLAEIEMVLNEVLSPK